MNVKKSKKLYDLKYIEKIFKVIPLIFIVFLCIISLFVSYIILDSKQKRDVDLLKQKKVLQNEFQKKEKLINFSIKIKENVNDELANIYKILKENTYKSIGALEKKEIISKISLTRSILEKYEKQNNIDIVLFDKSDYKVIFGFDKIKYLSRLIFGTSNKKYNTIIMKYIASQGKYNLQEWKNDLTGALRLSFFDKFSILNKEYFVGTFSKIENIRSLTKNTIINEINLLKNNDDYNIWFLDLITKKTYNFKKQKKLINAKDIILENRKRINYQILSDFSNFKENYKKYESYVLFDNRYKFLLSINYDNNIKINESTIKEKYNTLFSNISIYIIFFSILLVIFSLIFSNFTKNILNRYNKKLQDRTKLLTHWKNRFELAIIASNDGLWDIDFETDDIYFSNKWFEISGYKKGEILKFSHWIDLIHKNDINQVKLHFDEIFAGQKENFICEYRLKTKNEGFKWILARGKLFLDKDTGHKRMLMMSMDIDKNKRMKKELLDVELLVEDGKIVIFKLQNNEKLNIKYISNAIKNYGFTKKSFEIGEMSFLDLIYKDDINIVKVAINAALHQDLSDFTFVCRVINAANEIRWIYCRTLVLKDYSGNVISFYGYMNDITKIKLSEQELKQKVRDELEKNREKDRILIQQSKLAAMGEMIGNIAHQWRQPLNNISLFLQFLKDGYKNDSIKEEMINKYFNKSFTQIEYMSQTIDDFRNFYKPSKEKTNFSLNEAIASTLEIIKAQLKNESIEIIEEIENTNLYTFENQLRQVILNILNNAQDAIKSRKEQETFDAYIRIKSKVENKKVNIEISNNGGCIDDAIINRIFEPYFTTKFESQGTGIGLYMAKSIIEANLKGMIQVENIENGVLFKIILDSK